MLPAGLRPAAITAVLAAAAACREGRRDVGGVTRVTSPPAVEVRGHIVLPRTSATPYGVPADSAIPELAPTAVPPPVRRAADAEARAAEYRAECTRFFAAGPRVLALLNAECPSDPTILLFDGQLLVAFTAEGRRVGPVAGPYGRFYTDAVPFSRNAQGRPVH